MTPLAETTASIENTTTPRFTYSIHGGYTNNPTHSNELTTLPNRQAFEHSLRFAVDQCPGEFALISMDVDGLGEANDEHGHDTGDRLLRSVASILFLETRPTDDFTPKHVPNHISGDEFNILLPGASTQQDVDSFISRMESVLDAVGIKVSMAGAPHMIGETSDAYTKRIDDLLRMNKQAGIIKRCTDEQKQVIEIHGLPIIETGINPKHIRLLVTAGLQDQIRDYLSKKDTLTQLDLRAQGILGEMALSPLNPRTATPILHTLLNELVTQDTANDSEGISEQPTLF